MTTQQHLSINGEFYDSRNRKNSDAGGIVSEEFIVRSQAVVSRTVAGETLIVPVRGRVGDLASIYRFNQTGSSIWKLLENPTTLVEIADAMAREFDVTREQAQSDAVHFISEMSSAGLVEVLNAVAATEKSVGREGLAAASVK